MSIGSNDAVIVIDRSNGWHGLTDGKGLNRLSAASWPMAKPMSLTTLIVDDEPLAREGLRALLSTDPEVSAIREARDGSEAVASIRQSKPDLVFLDVQMPEMDGFVVVREIGAEEMPAVVFVTAHDRYAIQAFEINALDYLMKPVTEERFGKALMRARLVGVLRPRTELQSRASLVVWAYCRVEEYAMPFDFQPILEVGSSHSDRFEQKTLAAFMP